MNKNERTTVAATMIIIIAFISSFFFRPVASIAGGILFSIGVIYSTCFLLYKAQPKIWDEVHKAKEEKNNNVRINVQHAARH